MGKRDASPQPQRGCGASGAAGRNPVGVENLSPRNPRQLVPRNRGLEDTIPLGLHKRRWHRPCIGFARGSEFLNGIRARSEVPKLQLTGRDACATTVFRGGAGGRGSSGAGLRRWCLQTEISASVIRRGRRKTPRWLCLGGGRTNVFFRHQPVGLTLHFRCYPIATDTETRH